MLRINTANCTPPPSLIDTVASLIQRLDSRGKRAHHTFVWLHARHRRPTGLAGVHVPYMRGDK